MVTNSTQHRQCDGPLMHPCAPDAPGLGVTLEASYDVKRIDSDYFSEE